MYIIIVLFLLCSLSRSDSWKFRAWNARSVKALCAAQLLAASMVTAGSTSVSALSCVDGCYSECMKVAPGEGSKEYCKTTCEDDCSSSSDTAGSTTTSSTASSSIQPIREKNDIRDDAPQIFDWIPQQLLQNYVDSQMKYGATP